ncbi:MAG: hypothetical protein H7A45_08010 [Verrucomicrobiales bacterium]|nr:hypothetical protein [Verrucomicrobiales bacterium]
MQTKLHAPPPGAHLLDRPRLLHLLNENPRRPLTLVSAPAGYGKSTLVAQWLPTCGAPSTWLSLGEAESDLRDFLRYVVAAVRKLFPRACPGTARMIEALDLPPLPVIVESLGNDLEAVGRPFVLVLDDYYHIHGDAVQVLLNELLRYPPVPLHLVIVTRHDPPLGLASLRASGGLLELRQDQLRFSVPETRAVLKAAAAVELESDSLDEVDGRMEGWIAGVRLLCLVLRDRADAGAFLRDSWSGHANIHDYLFEQVLQRQPEDVREWLLRISVLDRFCAALIGAVCGRTGLGGSEFLETIRRKNLFVIPLDTQGRWFRFHHLFQHLLQQQLSHRLGADETARLHALASEWFAANGLVDEAVDHALTAGNPQAAVRIVEAQRLPALEGDRWPALERWLAKLPPHVKRGRFEILLAEAWIAQQHFRLAELPRIVEHAEALCAGQPVAPHLLGELNFFLSYLSFWQGDGERSQTFVDQALALLPENAGGMVRSHVELQVGLTGQILGRHERAVQQLTRWIEQRPLRTGIVWERVIFGRAALRLLAGDLPRAKQDARELNHDGERTGKAFIQAWGSCLEGIAAFQARDLPEARRLFRRVVERRYTAHTRSALDALAALALAHEFEGDSDQADGALDEAVAFARWTKDPRMIEVADSARARAALARGDLSTALDWQRSFIGQMDVPSMVFFLEQPCLTECRVLIASGAKDALREAEIKLATARQETTRLHYDGQTLEIRVLQALVHQARGAESVALAILDEALAFAGASGWVRPFCEPGRPMADLLDRLRAQGKRQSEIDRIRSALQEAGKADSGEERPAPGFGQAAIEALTPREQDTLELLAQRLYDKEIADALSVSIWTVKTHLKHVFQKLDVRNRRQAVVKAAELGLLPSPTRPTPRRP